jgi:hypothetical protein
MSENLGGGPLFGLFYVLLHFYVTIFGPYPLLPPSLLPPSSLPLYSSVSIGRQAKTSKTSEDKQEMQDKKDKQDK